MPADRQPPHCLRCGDKDGNCIPSLCHRCPFYKTKTSPTLGAATESVSVQSGDMMDSGNDSVMLEVSAPRATVPVVLAPPQPSALPPLQPNPLPVPTPGRSARKRPRPARDSDSEDDRGPKLVFLENPNARTKAHSKRVRVVLKKVLAINTVTRPYILLYISRPESVCQKNGKAITFISDNLSAIVGSGFLDDIHERVMKITHNNVQNAIDTDQEVERIRQEKQEGAARLAAIEMRCAAEESRLLDTEARIAVVEAQLAALHNQGKTTVGGMSES